MGKRKENKKQEVGSPSPLFKSFVSCDSKEWKIPEEIVRLYEVEFKDDEAFRALLLSVLAWFEKGSIEWTHVRLSSTFPESIFVQFPDFKFSTAPSLSSLDDVRLSALNERGVQRRLDSQQLKEISTTAQFSVDSRNFVGEQHRYQLSSFLMVGTRTLALRLKRSIAFGWEQFAVSIPRRLWAKNCDLFNLRSSILRLVRFPLCLSELFFGHSHLRASFDVASLSRLCRFAHHLDADTVPDSPLSHTMRECVQEVFDSSHAAWEDKRVRFIASLKANSALSPREINQAILEEQERLLICSSSKLPNHLQRRMRALALYFKHRSAVLSEREAAIEGEKRRLRAQHPIRSLSTAMFKKDIMRFQSDFDERSAHFEIMRRVSAESDDKTLNQFLDRDMDFLGSVAPDVARTIASFKEPSTIFTLERRIWRPANWRILRDGDDRFYSDKFANWRVHSSHFGWRWTLFASRYFVCLSNFCFWLLVSIFFSPLSLSALFRIDAFHPDKEVDVDSGELVVNRSVKVETLLSQISRIVTSIRQSRESFERIPDTGLLSKRFSRLFNVVWNYLFKGFIGILFTIAFYPLAVTLNVCFCSVLLLASPLVVLMFLFARALFCLLIFQLDRVSGASRSSALPLLSLLLKELVVPLISGACSLLASLLLHPLLAVLAIVVTFLSTLLHFAYDRIIFLTIIRPRGRVPSHNTFVCARVSGPGLARTVHFEVGHMQIVLASHCYLERQFLRHFRVFVSKLIDFPQAELDRKVRRALAPITSEQTCKLRVNTAQAEWREAIDERLKALEDQLPKFRSDFSTWRASSRELKLALDKAEIVIRRFFEERILPSISVYSMDFSKNLLCENVDEISLQDRQDHLKRFWNEQNLLPGDFSGLTASIISKIFGHRLLEQPLERQDLSFSLEFDQMTAKRFLRTLLLSTDERNLPDHLDVRRHRYDETSAEKVHPGALSSLLTEVDRRTLSLNGEARMSSLSGLRVCLSRGVLSSSEHPALVSPLFSVWGHTSAEMLSISREIYHCFLQKRNPRRSESVVQQLQNAEGKDKQWRKRIEKTHVEEENGKKRRTSSDGRKRRKKLI